MRYSLAIAVGLLAASPAPAKLPVKTLTLHEKTKTYEITIAYPQTGNKAIDAEMAAWARKEAANFQKNYTDDATPDHPYELDAEFNIARNDGKIFALSIHEDMDAGGAHPNQFPYTFNFLMPEGWRIYLPEIFAAKALKAISAYATRDLDKRLTGPDSMSDTDWIARGAGADWSNFAAFTLMPGTLDIEFPSYQVAAYAAGPQESKIPLSVLRGTYRPDWHAPAASFDCNAANTRIEHAVCSDVTLARLDRAVADGYAQKLGGADNDAAKKQVRDAQRGWLVKRNLLCKDQRAQAAVACLTGFYKARVAALGEN